ncbi:rCG40946, partial [Rattus norvegicus]
MSPLIRSIVDITEVFNQYASQSCDGASLSKRELKNLLERELGDVLQ